MIRPVLLIAAVAALAACTPAETETDVAATPADATAPAADVAADASWTATQDRYRDMETAPSDPLEALEWRAVGCEHLGGEFAGDNSERDQALTAQMDDLRCGDDLMADARAMREAQAGDPAVAARLDAILAVYG